MRLAAAAIACALLCGCASRRPAPQTSGVRASGEVVSARIASATKRARILHDAVPIDLRPAVAQLQDDLKAATEAKLEQDTAVEQLGRDITIQAQQLAGARTERDAALTDRNRWRRRGQTLMFGVSAIAGAVVFSMLPAYLGWWKFAVAAAIAAACYGGLLLFL